MYPRTHILFGLLMALLIKLIFLVSLMQALIIFASAFLIDIDHYLYYVFKKKDLSPFRAYAWFIELDKRMEKLSAAKRKQYKTPLMIFHGIEFWLILLILSFYSRIFTFILIGVAVHMILDYVDIYRERAPFYAKFSQIYTCIKNKNKKEIK